MKFFIGRNPPLRQVQFNNRTGIWEQPGWHVVLPYNNDLHGENVDLNSNSIYSSITMIRPKDGIINSEVRNYKVENLQTKGPRNDMNDKEFNEVETFFQPSDGYLEIQDYDKTAQRISNRMGMGFSFLQE